MSSPDRTPPPAELSLKYMAWDVKKLSEKLDALPALVRQLEILNATLAMMLPEGSASPSKITKLMPKDEIPF